MTGIIDWAASRARMVLAFVLMSVLAGTIAYVGLPKEGEPDIDIPGLFVSVPFPGISAEDSETLLVKPIEQEMEELDGLKEITATAAEGFAGVFMEFEFGWDKSATIADVRDAMGRAEASFPDGADQFQINEINFSEFPIMIVSLSGMAPERTLLRLATEIQDRLEGMPAVLEAGLAGHRDEMLEVLIDPLALEAYNVTAGELLNVVNNNNLLIPAGTSETATGAFAVKLPGAFDTAQDVYSLPVKVNGDRVVTLGDLAQINLTFEDRLGTARHNGETTVAIQVVKRLGFNIIDTAAEVRAEVDAAVDEWPEELREAVTVDITLDQSRTVKSMVSQLEGSVMTAIALVMIVVLATLGTRSALLVGFAIPTSFLLCFVLLGIAGIAISNIVMFGLILAVGMLVDGAIVVTEYADKRIKAGTGPMTAYTDAAKRMFWPVVSSTATTLCAFLPMLFWPGVAGQFMGMLPVTLIAVLSASLLVALIYLPVLGGVAGRMSRGFGRGAEWLRETLWWPFRVALVVASGWAMFTGALQTINPSYLLGEAAPAGLMGSAVYYGFGPLIFVLSCFAMSTTLGSVSWERRQRRVRAGYRRTPFGVFVHFLVGNPVMPLVAIGTVGAFVVGTFITFAQNNNGVEFFVESELENAIVYVRARGNLSLEEQDALLRQAEQIVLETPGVASAFAFAGDGGLNTAGPAGGTAPADAVGQVQVEMIPWEERPTVRAPWFSVFGFQVTTEVVDPDYDGDLVAERMLERLRDLPGVKIELSEQERGPASGKPVHLRLRGNDWEELRQAATDATALFESTPGLVDVDNTLPLPGIDWEIDVDVEKAGRFGADVATVGAMVQLVTRGILLDTYTPEGNDEEIEIRLRLPEEDRVLSTLDSLKVRTPDGLVPLANFIERRPVPRLAQIDRIDGQRYFDVRADVVPDFVKLVDGEGATVDFADAATLESDAAQARLLDEGLSPVPVTPSERIEYLTGEMPGLLPDGIAFEWTGDQEDQAESQAFLQTAFLGALGLMFVILLAQFNSVYNAVLVLLAVVLSTTGVLIGMLVMGQTFSIIMTGTGIVALAGIVVNNNIVLIDTYQEYSRYMPRIEAITRTAEDRIRPVLLTTLTTMAGLAPMMFGLSLDFLGGGYSLRSPTALWWIQLATAVVFGLGVATVLTLLFTPAMLALRVWFWVIVAVVFRSLARLGASRMSRRGQDWALRREARRVRSPMLLWTDEPADDLPEPLPGAAVAAAIRPAPEEEPEAQGPPAPPLRAAE
jgi:multidrug efflux pump